jgi:hypothetical protein
MSARTVGAAGFAVLMITSIEAWGTCQIPFMSASVPPILRGTPGAVADTLTKATTHLIEAVECLNKEIRLLELRLETEQMRRAAAETTAKDLRDRLDALEQRERRGPAPNTIDPRGAKGK